MQGDAQCAIIHRYAYAASKRCQYTTTCAPSSRMGCPTLLFLFCVYVRMLHASPPSLLRAGHPVFVAQRRLKIR